MTVACSNGDAKSQKNSLNVDDKMTPYDASMIFHDYVQLIYMRISECLVLPMWS